MIVFGNLQSRNTCLKNMSKLPKGLWISTQVPKIYLEKNKEFEEQAKNLRLSENVATRIEFDGPMIQLKYGLKPSEKGTQIMYKIFDEWKPKPQIITPKQSPNPPINTPNVSFTLCKTTSSNRIILKGLKNYPPPPLDDVKTDLIKNMRMGIR